MNTITGIETLIKKLDSLGGDITQVLPTVMRDAMVSRVETKASAKCPVNTGTLRSSIKTVIQEQSPDRIVVVCGTNKAYAPHVEYGTGAHQKADGHEDFIESITRWAELHGIDEPGALIYHIQKYGTQPHPFMRPAWEEGKDQLLIDVKNGIGREVRKLMR